MQSTSFPLDVMRLWKLVLLFSFSLPSFHLLFPAFPLQLSFILCLFLLFNPQPAIDFYTKIRVKEEQSFVLKCRMCDLSKHDSSFVQGIEKKKEGDRKTSQKTGFTLPGFGTRQRACWVMK